MGAHMLQLLQSLKTGDTQLMRVPCPELKPGHLLIQAEYSLISPGTERMLLQFGQSGLLAKARAQPEKVRQVVDKIKTDGVLATASAVHAQLNTDIPMGYCHVGRVLAVSADVTRFAVGDRVISNGHHAEVVCVPKNLCAKVPAGLSPEQAVFTVIGAIALQGIRLAKPTLGETFVVMGLGLVGLMAVQLLKANGCRVLAADFIAERLALAADFGAETIDLSSQDLVAACETAAGSQGVDGVLLCASTTSDDPVRQAATICRQQGRIVCVGVVGLSLSRDLFYKKELRFQVSCSYGPGRYDPEYEEKGKDYPLGYVRWTEQRNFEAVLRLLAEGKLKTAPLVTDTLPFEQAKTAYALLSEQRQSLAILLRYQDQAPEILQRDTFSLKTPLQFPASQPVLAMVGAGHYAQRVLVPALKKAAAVVKTVVSAQGISGTSMAKRLGALESTTAFSRILKDPEISGVVIATRHNQHAKMVCEALHAKKAVFVEKPLALSLSELDDIERTIIELQALGHQPYLMVGFNRRFSPLVLRAKALLSQVSAPMAITIQVNAGHIPEAHWTQDPQVGGGRLVGEGCHFIDLMRYLVGAPVVQKNIVTMPDIQNTKDTFTLQLRYQDGSIGTLHYFANGHRRLPKERIEIFSERKVIQLMNFKTLKHYGFKGRADMRLWRQDKGQKSCMAHYIETLKTGQPAPIALDALLETSRIAIALRDQNG